MDFFVDPDRLAASGRAMEDTGVAAASELGGLHRDIAAGAGAPWAEDPALESAYRDLAAATGEALDLLGTVLRRGGTGVQAMAASYRRADDTVGDGFGELGKALRGSP